MRHGILKSGITLPTSAITLEEHICDGGEAEIWSVVQRGLSIQQLAAKLVALPTVADAGSEDRSRIQRLMDQEATHWSKISGCPHIMPMLGQIQEAVQIDESEYFVLGFLTHRAACDLKRALLNEEFSTMGAKALLEFMRQLAEGIKSAHDFGVAHMDVKPENVLLFRYGGAEYYARWTDFGVSISSDFAPDRFGTPRYMSPERFEKGRAFSVVEYKRADVFSLGILFYEIITGCHPFIKDQTTTAVLSEEFWRTAINNGAIDYEPLKRRGLSSVERMMHGMLSKSGSRPDMALVIAHLKHAQDELFIEDYSLRQKTLLLSSGIYRWNPGVHALLGSTLHYYLVDCEQPASDLEWITTNLSQSGLHGYACYCVLGEFDYIFRIWLKRAYLKALDDLWTRFAATCGGRVRRFMVEEAEPFYGSKPLGVSNETELLSAIAETTDYDRQEQWKTLSHAGIAMGRIAEPCDGTRLFVLLRWRKQAGALHRRLIAHEIRRLLGNGAAEFQCNDLSIYQGAGDYEVLAKFRLPEFKQVAPVLERLLGVTEDARKGGINIAIETYAEVVFRQTVECDDGSIIHEVTKFKREPK
jgi:serine/threonine protein kinase